MKVIQLPVVSGAMTRGDALQAMRSSQRSALLLERSGGYEVLEFKHLLGQPDGMTLEGIKLGSNHHAITITGTLVGPESQLSVTRAEATGVTSGMGRLKFKGPVVDLAKVFAGSLADFVVVPGQFPAQWINVVTRSESIAGFLSIGPSDWYCTGPRTHHFSDIVGAGLPTDPHGRRLCDKCQSPVERFP